MSKTSYVEEFNKQLAAQLEVVRRAQPNHIPVYAMKYKNASKYLIQDLEEPLRLFPKKFKLQTIHKIIQKQSNNFSRTKLKEDSKVKAKGQLFEVPEFYLYTIELIQRKQSEEAGGEQKSQRPIGTFVRLGLDMTFQEAFEKYGRENVLTIVYTDATEVRSQSDRSAATKVEKWLTRVILFILFLVLVPYLMREQEPGFQTPLNSANTSHIDSHYVQDGPQIEQKAEDEDKLDIDVHLGDNFEFNEGKTIHYDEDNI